LFAVIFGLILNLSNPTANMFNQTSMSEFYITAMSIFSSVVKFHVHKLDRRINFDLWKIWM